MSLAEPTPLFACELGTGRIPFAAGVAAGAWVFANGVTAEPTDIYDPGRSLVSAYTALFDQWRRIFEIGAANMRRGTSGATAMRLLKVGLAHLHDRRSFPISS